MRARSKKKTCESKGQEEDLRLLNREQADRSEGVCGCVATRLFQNHHGIAYMASRPPNRNRRKAPTHINASSLNNPSVSVSSFSFSPEEFLPNADINRPIEAFVDRVSEDGRRMYREIRPIEPPSPIRNARATTTQGAAPSGSASLNVTTNDDRYEMFNDNSNDYDPPSLELPSAARPKKAIFSVSFPRIQIVRPSN